MHFKISIAIVVVKVLAMIALHTLQVSCQVNLTANFDTQDSIIEGTIITLTCRVEDRNNGHGATIISGSQAIFNCPSFNTVHSNRIYLVHIHLHTAIAECGELVFGRIVEVQNGTTTVYIAQIYIVTTIAMNGGYVECSELGQDGSQQIQLSNIIGRVNYDRLYCACSSNYI